MEFTTGRQQQGPIHHEMGARSTPPPLAHAEVRYHECLRNHAAALGGHVVDGCGEFMPGPDDALKCAACGCHRSFHRKDDDARQLLLPPAPVTPTTAPRIMPPPHLSYPRYAFPYHGTPGGSGGTTTPDSSSDERGPPSAAQQGQHRKRFRTKFTPEQKARMLAFAERLGWRMQKQEEALVEQFCAQVGVRRQVFKVWMHNNKHISGRRQQEQQSQQQQP
jgi:ZF-HD class homeobox domain-containing protein